MKWQSDGVKKVKYLKIGPVESRSMGLIVLCVCVCVCVSWGNYHLSGCEPGGRHIASEASLRALTSAVSYFYSLSGFRFHIYTFLHHCHERQMWATDDEYKGDEEAVLDWSFEWEWAEYAK